MYSNEVKTQNFFLYWLAISLILVFLLIIIGGLTRLTNSGLSIIEWELFKGILPPLNDNSWNLYFEKYKTIPQYKLLNFDMSLEEFKVIYYWEYIHRILARIIGLFFLIPLIYFYFSDKINKRYLSICSIIFFLILVQGIIGWYMVKSGLVYDVTVSHYRLSLHLGTAIIIISSIFWLLKNVLEKKNKIFFNLSLKNLPFLFLILIIFFQVIVGAFVSGLDAGNIYQTWPMMGNTYFPNDIIYRNFFNLLEFDNHSLVQFYHRNLAYIIIFYSLILTITIYKRRHSRLYKPVKILNIVLALQVSLGIITLISGLNIYIASAHQILAVLLIFSAVNLYYFNIK